MESVNFNRIKKLKCNFLAYNKEITFKLLIEKGIRLRIYPSKSKTDNLIYKFQDTE